MAEKELLTIDEFIAIYSQTRSSTYKEIKKGSLAFKKQGSRTMITREAAEKWKHGLPDGMVT